MNTEWTFKLFLSFFYADLLMLFTQRAGKEKYRQARDYEFVANIQLRE